VIFVVPTVKAVTSPVVISTVATPVFVLLHVPPASPVEVYVVVAPIHRGVVPLTVPALAFGFTVMVNVHVLVQLFTSV